MIVLREVMAAKESTGLALPLATRIGTLFLNLVSLAALSVCSTRRIQNIRNWRALPLSYWLLLFIYADTMLFVVSIALINSVGINMSTTACQAGILVCLSFYLSSKIVVYLFLVEKAHVVRGRGLSRRKDKVYLFNCFGMLLPYGGVAIANFIKRIGYIREDGMCIIGMERVVLLPLVIFDVVVNLYLTATFIVPIRNLHSYNNNPRLKKMAVRTFIGSLATLASAVTNIVVMMVLNGEPGWLCFTLCNIEILFTTMVLHWVTVSDSVGESRRYSSNRNGFGTGDARLENITKKTTLKQTTATSIGRTKGTGVETVIEVWKDIDETDIETPETANKTSVESPTSRDIRMSLRRGLLALLRFVSGTNAASPVASKIIREDAHKIVAWAPPLPTSTLVADFQKDGVNSSWADGHPKAWGTEAVRYKGQFFVDVSPDEKFLAVSSGTNMTIRDLDTLDIVSTTKGDFEGEPDGITIVPDKNGGYNVLVDFLNYTTGDGTTLFHLSPKGLVEGEQIQYQGRFSVFDGRRQPLSQDFRRFLLINGHQVNIRDLDNPQSTIALVGHTNSIMSAAFSPDGYLVSTASWDNSGRVWNASTGEVIHTFGSTGGQNWKTNFSPDGKYVTVANAGKQAAVKIWPVSNMAANPMIITNFGNWVRTVSWSPDSKFIAAGSYGLVQIFSIDEQKVVQRWEMEDRLNFESWDLLWIESDDSGLKLAYRTTAGLEVYDFKANLKYRWGPDAYAQYDGGGSGDGTNVIRSKGWIGGRDADGNARFYKFPI
ncbi:WD40 repeat-like protein [Paramyrothecium foliicola]|nr:WD40 repeat-like protein [Paramyrothecium foliicola]